MAKSKRARALKNDRKAVAVAQKACRDAVASGCALKGLRMAEKEAASCTPSTWAMEDLKMWQERAEATERKAQKSRLKLQEASRTSSLAWRLVVMGKHDRDRRKARKQALREAMSDSIMEALGTVNTASKVDQTRILNEMAITANTVLTPDLYYLPKDREARMFMVSLMLSEGVDVLWE